MFNDQGVLKCSIGAALNALVAGDSRYQPDHHRIGEVRIVEMHSASVVVLLFIRVKG